MSCMVSISRVSEYTRGSQLDSIQFEVRIADDADYMQSMTLADASDLVVLRNVLSAYIRDNNLDQQDNEK